MSDFQPLITILTPVFIGAACRAECVLAQDDQNWVFAIVYNSSGDQTRSVTGAHSGQEQAPAGARGPVGRPLASSTFEKRGSA